MVIVFVPETVSDDGRVIDETCAESETVDEMETLGKDAVISLRSLSVEQSVRVAILSKCLKTLGPSGGANELDVV